MIIVAVDTGGTFTDLAAYDIDSGQVRYTKSLTTYDALERGVFDCMAKVGLDLSAAKTFKHGTTLVINALLQRVGAKVALVTTQGFRDVLETGRGNRPDPFDLYYRRDPVLVPRDLRLELPERISGAGEPVVVPEREQVQRLAERLRQIDVQSVGISFLNAYLNDSHERQVQAWLREMLPGLFITRGTELTREWYEYERTATVAANAYVGPQVAGYVHTIDQRLSDQGFKGQFFLMGSSGGVLARVEGKIRRVKIGQSIGAWKLETVEGREATFKQGEQERKLPLAYAKLNVPLPVAAAPAAAQRPQAPSQTSANPQSQQDEQRERLRRRNQMRIANGLPPLTE